MGQALHCCRQGSVQAYACHIVQSFFVIIQHAKIDIEPEEPSANKRDHAKGREYELRPTSIV